MEATYANYVAYRGGGFTFSSCVNDGPISPRDIGGRVSFGVDCELGCIDPDPNPNAPGYYLGSGMTDEACYWNNYTDGDQDGLGDFCEKNLAAAFAPELYYYSGDNVKREPRWAARVSDD